MTQYKDCSGASGDDSGFFARQKDDKLAELRAALAAEREAHELTKAALYEAQSACQWMVAHAADQKLDGYRELGQRAADAENARDVAQQETARAVACIEMNRKGWEADRAALLQTQQAWATEYLRAGCVDAPGAPAPVAALVRAHAGQPVGECQSDICGKRSPLKPVGHIPLMVCAWKDGCNRG